MEIFSMSERLMVYRKRAGLSKKELAERAGVSVSTVSKYEDNPPNPDHNILSKFSLILGVTINRLMFGFDDPHKDMPEESLIKE